MNPIYKIGETPSRPLGIRVDDVTSLHDYDSVSVEIDMPGSPSGIALIDPEDPTLLLYTFTGPFTTAGHYEGTVVLHTGSGEDYTSEFAFDVEGEYPLAIVTPSEVRSITFQSTTVRDVARAQALVQGRLDVDLTDVDWLATLSSDDVRRLQAMVAWTSLMPETTTESYTSSDIKSESYGDVSITYGSSSRSASRPGVILHPVAESLIDKLSFMRPPRTLFSRPGTERVVVDPATNTLVIGDHLQYFPLRGTLPSIQRDSSQWIVGGGYAPLF